ncbi:MAG: hypothetical protein HRT38_18210 [Alteromonadaceae bacterium]|nr:hypothetical protein [Alteromonadaceae bacterium]
MINLKNNTFTRNSVSAAIALALALGSIHANAKDYAIGLSPYSSVEAKKDQVRGIINMVAELKADDTMWLIDGYSLETIGRMRIPNNPAYKSKKAKIAANLQAIGQLAVFAKQDNEKIANTQGVPIGTIRIPQLLRSIANNKPSSDIEVILFGSPHYVDRSEVAFSMVDGQFPSTGHLLNRRTQTPYGLADDKALLSGMRVHWFYGSDRFINNRHSSAVERLWTLYTELTNGKLVTFSEDLATVLSRATNNAKAPAHSYQLDPNDNKIEMIRLPVKVMSKSIRQRPISSTALPLRKLRHATDVEVGITWNCNNCDLDLYAKANPTAPILYFGNTKTPQGTYFKDYQYSPKGSNGFETINFKTPLDLRVMKFVINFYRGNVVGGVKGELRLTIDGKTYSKPFHLKSPKGNKGADVSALLSDNKIISQYSVVFEPLKFTKVDG